MKVLVNSLLVSVFVGLLIIPVFTAHELIAFQVEPSGLVAGLRTIDEQVVNVLPNVKDFNGYVDFQPQTIKNGIYQDTVTVTAFQRQKATYRSIYTVYNLSSDQKIQAQIISSGIIPTDDSFEKVFIWIGKESTRLAFNLPAGTTMLEGVNTANFTEGDQILVGDEKVPVIAISENRLVVTPLKKSHLAGETVYPQSIVITPGVLEYPESNVVIINPNDAASVFIEIQGTASLIRNDQKVNIPLEFRFNYED